MSVSDVCFVGGSKATQEVRKSLLAAQKISVAEPDAPSHVTVIDGTEMDDAALDQLLSEIDKGQSAILVLFKLSRGVSLRDRQDALLAAGADDVMADNAPEDDFRRRVVGLLLRFRAPRVLVVEDEEEIGDWIETHLRLDGSDILRAATLAEARSAFESGPIDALVVDRKLPDGDGLDLVALLRENQIRTPALFLSAYNTIEDRLRGLEEAGGDDYIAKTVHEDELRARVRLALRPKVNDDILFFGPLEVNRKDRIIRWRGERIELERKPTEMLVYLAERADLPIPQRMIYLDVWQKMFMDIESKPVTAAKFRLVRDFKKFLADRGEVFPEFLSAVDDAYVFLTEPLLRLPERDAAKAV